MKKALLLLIVGIFALLGSAFGQSSTANHNVNLNVPFLYRLTVGASNVNFNFNAAGTVATVDSLDRAGLAAYEAFLNTATGTQLFAPTNIDGATPDAISVEVLTNSADWDVTVAISSGTLPEGNERLHVKSERDDSQGAKKGTAQATSYTPFGTSATSLAKATSGGQGKSFYNVYYAYEANIADDLSSDQSGTVTVEYTLTAP